jgi:hypothetical protein
MMNHTRWLVGIVGLGLGLAAPAAAQSSGTPPIEIGLDAVLAHRSTNFDGPGPSTSSETLVQLPAGQIRVGFLLNQMIELEPALGLNYIGGDGGHTTTANLVIGLPINLQPDFSKPNWYVRPLVGFQHFSGSTGSSSTSATQVSFGAGVGLRLPIDRRFAGRFEANYTHGNESDIFGSYNQFGLLAGLSFFTR